MFRICGYTIFDELATSGFENVSNADPCMVARHFGRHIKLKYFVFQVEIQPSKRSSIALEELRWIEPSAF